MNGWNKDKTKNRNSSGQKKKYSNIKSTRKTNNYSVIVVFPVATVYREMITKIIIILFDLITYSVYSTQESLL